MAIIQSASICFLTLLCLVTISETGRLDHISRAHPSEFLVSSNANENNKPDEPTLTSSQEEEMERASTEQLIEKLASSGTDANKPSVRYILDLFEKMENGEDLMDSSAGRHGQASKNKNTDGTDVIRGLSASVPSASRHRADVTLSFPLSGFSEDETTELAELRLRPMRHHPAETETNNGRRQQRSDTSRLARRAGFQRVRISILDKEGDRQVERIYKVKWRRDETDGFTVLDITRILRDMAASNVQRFHNGTLEIILKKTRRPEGEKKKSRGRRDTVYTVHALNPEDDAILVVYSKSNSNLLEEEMLKHRDNVNAHEQMNKRSKRAARKGRKSAKGKCSPKDLMIDFETLGWADDIIFPTRYNARTCSGKCPSPVSHDLKPTNHAILQSMMRIHDKSVKRPCCVPVSYKPLMMLYKRADGNVEIRHHPNMIVDECGCR